ncbi:MAG: hypothetical protein RLZZ628_1295 [Bacteroidota bacterium]|jgi:hypothetical protein
MKLILVHGIAQERFDEMELKQRWIDQWKIGLAKNNPVLPFPAEITIEFPYYGKLLAQLAADAKKMPADTETVTRSGQFFNPELFADFEAALLQEFIQKESTLIRAQKAELTDLLEPKRGMLEKAFTLPVVHKFAEYIDAKPDFAKKLLSFVETAYMYLWNYKVQDAVHKHIEKVFEAKTPCVVVGHSLGSILCYNVLQAHPRYSVRHLITIGSPLGTKTVQDQLKKPLSLPKCVQKGWFNALDKRDIVSLYPLNNQYFNILPPIVNHEAVTNFTDNAHGIEGYLQDPVVAKAIYDAVIYN